ncbi:TPA: restriction endonuclease subunit S [Citrobacter amalonaticus]|nr:restriction endonuclease subunit S [Citrobacter amalonaticus]
MVPKLRFRAFSEEYNIRKLKETADIVTGNTPSTSNSNFYGGEYMFVSPVDINEGKFVSHTKTTVSKEGFINGREIPAYSVMFVCIGSTIGKLAINSNPCITNQQINSLICNAYFSANYLYSILEKHSKKIKELAGIQAVPLINKTTFSNVELYFPNIEEQTKVASFISSIDEKISLMDKQYDLLCQYKKGMMQKIFSQEFRLKDKDGKDFPKWDNKKIGSLISEYKCKTTKENEWPVMTSSRSGLVLQREYYGENRLTERSNIGFNIIPCDYLTYRSRSDDGLFFFNQNKLNITGCISVYYPVFKFKYGNNYFYTTMFNYYKNLFRAYAVGSSQLVLSITDLKEMKFLIPSPDEQKKISEFLSAIDKRIDTAKSTLDKLKIWKQGLLQQMFV